MSSSLGLQPSVHPSLTYSSEPQQMYIQATGFTIIYIFHIKNNEGKMLKITNLYKQWRKWPMTVLWQLLLLCPRLSLEAVTSRWTAPGSPSEIKCFQMWVRNLRCHWRCQICVRNLPGSQILLKAKQVLCCQLRLSGQPGTKRSSLLFS